MADEEKEIVPAEEAPEEEETADEETPDEPDDSEEEDKGSGDGKDYRKIADDQRKRAEKAEAELKKLKPKPAPKDEGQALSPKEQQRIDRIELNSLGHKDRDVQDYIIGAAKRLGVEISEAAADELVAARAEKILEAKKTKESTPPPKRGGSAPRSGGKLPDFAKMTDAEFDEWERKNRK